MKKNVYIDIPLTAKAKVLSATRAVAVFSERILFYQMMWIAMAISLPYDTWMMANKRDLFNII